MFRVSKPEENTASRLPQSRRLRRAWDSHERSAKQAASRLPQSRRLRHQVSEQTKIQWCPPQDCRSRGDCGFASASKSHTSGSRLKIAAVAATAAGGSSARKSGWKPPQDCRSRGDCGHVAGARLAAYLMPPQDCRSRGDCGLPVKTARPVAQCRLKIAAVAATAAKSRGLGIDHFVPPQDCRSRGDCGLTSCDVVLKPSFRLKIAAVAATAASSLWATL